MRLDLQRNDTNQEYRKELKAVFTEASAGNVYDQDSSETFQLTFPDNLVMEPGEVIIFSYDGPTKTYQRLPGVKDQEFSGVNLDMTPGITGDLRKTSGIRIVDPWKITLPSSVGIRFKTNIASGSKFQVAGVNRTPVVSEPFFSSFEAGTSSMTTGWSDGGSYLSITNPALSSDKRPYLVYDTSLKPENSPHPVNIISHFNLRASSYEQGNFFKSGSSAHKNSVGQEDLWYGQAFSQTSWNGTWLSNMGSNGYWGSSNTATNGSIYVSLFEVPRLPPLSIATLQHAQVTYMADDPTYPIGNSLAPVFGREGDKIANQTLTVINSGESRDPYPSQSSMVRPDWSFLINEALWDRYYFSSITPTASGNSAATFSAFQNGTDLPNSTFTHHRGLSETNESVHAKLFSGGEARSDSPTRVSENLLVDGAFNVNSTSVEAWRAILSSSRNLAINVQDSSTPRSVAGTAYSRTAIPFDRDDDKWHGYRSITDAQIDSIAREIVNQVRSRGPFLNLADFVNRRLVPASHPTQKKGALQAAIDASGVNSSFNVTLASQGFNNNNLNTWLSGRMDPASPVAMGAPGYLTQADVLTLIGPMLSARSDTFIIRAYGEYGSGGDLSRAWCEITVQRVPDYVDSSRTKGASPSWRPSDRPAAATYDTAPAKRRFVIKDFRWIAPDDV